MKNFIFTTLSLLLSSQIIFAQGTGNAIFFAEQGEKFFITINGEQQNNEALSNVKVQGLKASNDDFAVPYKVKVIFEDNTISNLDKTVYVHDSKEITFKIKTNKKGNYVMRMFSETDIQPVTSDQFVTTFGSPAPAQTTEVTTTTVTETTTTTTGNPDNGNTTNVDMDMMGVGTNVTVTDNTSTNPDGSYEENVSMDINMMGVEMNVDVSVSESGNGGYYDDGTDMSHTTTVTETTTTTTTNQPVAPAVGNGCWIIDNQSYADIKASIENKTFDDEQMTVAKQATRNNCLSAEQIKGIMEIFTFDDDRVDFAIFAHPYCADPNNYYKVNDALEYEMNINKLEKAIQP